MREFSEYLRMQNKMIEKLIQTTVMIFCGERHVNMLLPKQQSQSPGVGCTHDNVTELPKRICRFLDHLPPS